MNDVTLFVTSFGKAIVALLDGITRVPLRMTLLMIFATVAAIVIGQVIIH